MKIVHFVAWYFPENVGGTEVYVSELARRQQSAGIGTAIGAPDDVSASVRRYEWNGAQVFRYPIADTESLHAWLAEQAADIVHVHSISTGLGLAEIAAARRLGARVIFTAHLPALGFICQRGTLLRWGTEVCDGIVETDRCAACVLEQRGVPQSAATVLNGAGRALGSWTSAVPGRLGTGLRMRSIIEENRTKQRQLFDAVDFFVGLNDRALAIVRGNGAPESKLVLNRLGVGVRPHRVARRGRASGEPLRVGFIGRIHETKGIDLLVRAVLALPPSLPIAVEIHGPPAGSDQTHVARMLRDAASRDARVIVRGEVQRDEIEAVLRGLDVLCCPSIWFENGPTIALEAQAVGTPVIGSDAGAMPEFISDRVNGRIVPAGQWEPLRDALREIAIEPSIVEAWRSALPTPRSMDDVADDYATLYAQMLREAPRKGVEVGAGR